MSEKLRLSNTTNQISNSGFDELQQTNASIIIVCKFCSEDFDEEEYNTHKEECFHNSIGSRNRQELQTSINQSSLLNEKNDDDDPFYIPCQFCIELIESDNYQKHQITCKQQQEQKQRKTQKSIVLYLCKFCEEAYSSNELANHQIHCTQNLLMD